MERREFIAIAISGAGLALCGGCIFASTSFGLADTCRTTSDILGPFYRPGAPFRSNMRFDGIKGTGLKVQGKVRGSDCSTILSGAKIEIWHCNSAGEYDNTSDLFLHRASLNTDKEGLYSFSTIMPGRYLNGDSYRPAHIHFKVANEGYSELVTQLYFIGDPYLDTDPFSSLPKARQRRLDVRKLAVGTLSVNFDIWLERNPGLVDNTPIQRMR